jgi:hypothetical protein
MPDFSKIAQGLANNLIDDKEPFPGMEAIVIEAFHRGLQLGRTLPRPAPEPNKLAAHPARVEDDPWRSTH